MNTIRFKNETGRKMSLIVEPEAVNIDWEIGKRVEIHFNPMTDNYNDQLDLVLGSDEMVVFECRQYETKIFIDDELMYYTPPGRYW